MRIKSLVNLIIILVCGFYIYQHRANLINLYHHIYYSPCDFPVQYHIGSIDPKFKISEAELSSDIQEAANIWSNSISRDLFKENPQGGLAVNLIFDERQSLKNEINNLKNTLDDAKDDLEPTKASYEIEVQGVEKESTALNAEIKSWNAKGGAPEDVYQELKKRQSELQSRIQALNTQAKALNQSANAFNQKISELNHTVETFNQDLEKKPEEGLYDSKSQTISIYFNNGKDELVHTLAHEFGHSLGLDHNNNSESIMYSFTSKTMALSVQDLEDLNKVCQKRTILDDLLIKVALLKDRYQIGKVDSNQL